MRDVNVIATNDVAGGKNRLKLEKKQMELCLNLGTACILNGIYLRLSTVHWIEFINGHQLYVEFISGT